MIFFTRKTILRGTLFCQAYFCPWTVFGQYFPEFDMSFKFDLKQITTALFDKREYFLQPSPKLNSSFLGMPIGPLWAHKGPIWGKKLIILLKNHKIINKNLKIVNLEILKVKTWFWNKDLSSLDSIN